MRLIPTAIFSLSAAVAAQTFVVDAANRPGTNFTDLPTAAATVPNGATLLVRPGSYAGFALNQKGLNVLGEPGVEIAGMIDVDGLTSGQTVVLQGLHWPQHPSNSSCIELDACAGAIVIEDVTIVMQLVQFPLIGQALVATDCGRIALRDCDIQGIVNLTRCGVAVEQSRLEGVSALPFVARHTTPAIGMRDSAVQVTRSSLQGGNGVWQLVRASWAIFMNGTGDLRLLDSYVSGGSAGSRWPAIIGLPSSTVRVDRATTLLGVSGMTPTYAAMPHITATGAPPGGQLTATVSTEPGDLVVLAVGLPAQQSAVPTFADAFWLDPVDHVFAAIGTQQAATPIQATITVPGNAFWRGTHLVWHAACFGPVTGQQNSNPAVSLISR